jgi:murein DD-endopeptidase MepM/ murein hydrolase activator NlpD
MSLTAVDATQIFPFPIGSASLLSNQMPQPTTRPSEAGLKEISPSTNQVSSSGPSQQLEHVSREFETLLLSFVFKAMRKTIPKEDPLGKAQDRDWYTDLFDFELAKNFTRGKSVGLSAYLQQSFQRMQNRPALLASPTARGLSAEYRPKAAPPVDTRRLTVAFPFEPLSQAMILPVVGRLSSHYGDRPDPFTGEAKQHRGIDIISPVGTEIRAAWPGIVTFSGWKDGYGQTVILSHTDGYTTQYAHNSENLVQLHERVSHGQPVALVGQTGRATGPHVHFEVHKNGSPIDPMPLLTEKTAS